MEEKKGTETDVIEEELLKRLEDPNTLRVMNSMMDKMGALDEATTALKGVLDSLTDGIVERIFITMETMASLGDILGRPGMQHLVQETAHASHALASSLGKIKHLEESGDLDLLLEAARLFVAVKSAMTDGMVERLFTFAETGLQMADTAISGNAEHLVHAMLRSTNEAVHEAANDHRKLGLGSLMGAIKDPEMQKGLKIILALTKNLGKYL